MMLNTIYFGDSVYTKEGAFFKPTEVILNNVVSIVSLNISGGLNDKECVLVLSLVDDLKLLDQAAKREIRLSYENKNSIVASFIHEHFKDYTEEITQQIFDHLGIKKQDDLVFIDRLKLGSVSIYNDKNTGLCITLDYNILWDEGIPFTDQILAVRFDSEKRFLSVAHES